MCIEETSVSSPQVSEEIRLGSSIDPLGEGGLGRVAVGSNAGDIACSPDQQATLLRLGRLPE